MNVMVFTPVYRLEPETVTAIMRLEHDGPMTLIMQRDNPHEDGRENVLHQYQRGRNLFLQGDYDAMLIIESDIVPPSDALQKLIALDADCAYGVYRFRKTNIINIFERYPDKNGNLPRNEGESLSLHPAKLAQARRDGVTKCSGAGLGCVLIKRHVLERFEFWHEDQGGHCDTYFNRDVLQAGMVQLADMTIICGHIDERRTLWLPDKEPIRYAQSEL